MRQRDYIGTHQVEGFMCDCCSEWSVKLFRCDFCNRRFCLSCYNGAAEEVNGGLNVENTGWDVCYCCAEKDDVQLKILTEARDYAKAQVVRTGSYQQLKRYLWYRRRLCAMEITIRLKELQESVRNQ